MYGGREGGRKEALCFYYSIFKDAQSDWHWVLLQVEGGGDKGFVMKPLLNVRMVHLRTLRCFFFFFFFSNNCTTTNNDDGEEEEEEDIKRSARLLSAVFPHHPLILGSLDWF